MEQGKRSQCAQVLKYIEENGSITSLEAFEDLRILRLASRINDLKKLGYPIESKMETYFVNGIFKRYARYTLAEWQEI